MFQPDMLLTEPHAQEDHDYMATFNDQLHEVLKAMPAVTRIGDADVPHCSRHGRALAAVVTCLCNGASEFPARVDRPEHGALEAPRIRRRLAAMYRASLRPFRSGSTTVLR